MEEPLGSLFAFPFMSCTYRQATCLRAQLAHAGCAPSHFVFRARQELQATTFGPEPEPLPLVFPGTVAALFLSAAWCSEAGLRGGNEGADIGPGVDGDDLSGRDSVAICGSSLSGKKGLPPPPLLPPPLPTPPPRDIEGGGFWCDMGIGGSRSRI